jgi:dTDP-4-amino-4,6-dideoxygalactose transaminase
LAFPEVLAGDLCSFKDYSVGVDPKVFGMTRDELASALLNEGIETKKYFYPPLHQQKLYSECATSLPVTERISAQVLSLPIYESMTDEDIECVLTAAQTVAGQKKQR